MAAECDKTGKSFAIQYLNRFTSGRRRHVSQGVVHGSAFGVENHVRMAYAVPMPKPSDACRRIETACAALTPAVAAV